MVLQPAADLLHAKVIVQLLDTTLIDVVGIVIGRQEFCVTSARVSELPFFVPVPIFMLGHRFSFSAEVRRGVVETLGPGDYVNTAAVSWLPNMMNDIVIDLQRID